MERVRSYKDAENAQKDAETLQRFTDAMHRLGERTRALSQGAPPASNPDQVQKHARILSEEEYQAIKQREADEAAKCFFDADELGWLKTKPQS